MPVKIDELSAIIKQQIRTHRLKALPSEEGRVLYVGDGVMRVSALENVMQSEVLELSGGLMALVLNLESDHIVAAFLGDYHHIREGDIVTRTKRTLSVPAGDELLGRVVNALGQPIDEKPAFVSSVRMPVERVAPGVMTRKSIDQPLETGIMLIDALVPIGKGQRELIIGDRQTGKTSIAVDAIINQKGKNVICVYVAIGQKNSTVVQLCEKLKEVGAMSYTTIVSSTASDIDTMLYLAPYAAVAMAEHWMEHGKDVLIIYDDLTKHAIAYRSLSLLLRRPPGREAYPGDVFYLHSRLLERAGRLNQENGGGSITALPIIETQAGDISAYIPTNVISITDGQLFMQSSLFNAGQRPAVDIGLSVSRVGSAAQIKAIRQATGSLKLDLAQHRELESFSNFGSDIDESTKKILLHGKKVLELLKQHRYNPYSQIDQAIILLAIQKNIIKWIPVQHVRRFKTDTMAYFRSVGTDVRSRLQQAGAFDQPLIDAFLVHFKILVNAFVTSIAGYRFTDYGSIEEISVPAEQVTSAIAKMRAGVNAGTSAKGPN